MRGVLRYKKSVNSEVSEWSFVNNEDVLHIINMSISEIVNADIIRYYFFKKKFFMNALKQVT